MHPIRQGRTTQPEQQSNATPSINLRRAEHGHICAVGVMPSRQEALLFGEETAAGKLNDLTIGAWGDAPAKLPCKTQGTTVTCVLAFSAIGVVRGGACRRMVPPR